MEDSKLDKAIKGMECCFDDMRRSDSAPCKDCPYRTLPRKQNCQKVLFTDVLELLRGLKQKE